MSNLFILKIVALHLHLSAPLEYLNYLRHPSLWTYNFFFCVFVRVYLSPQPVLFRSGYVLCGDEL